MSKNDDDQYDRSFGNKSLIRALQNGPLEPLPGHKVDKRFWKEVVRDTRPESIRHLVCLCGNKEVELGYGITEDDGSFPRWVHCPQCGLKAGGRWSTKMSILAWEWMIDHS